MRQECRCSDMDPVSRAAGHLISFESGRRCAQQVSVSESNGLDDLEDGRTTDDEDKEGHHPRPHWILLVRRLVRLRHVSPQRHVL